MISIRRYLREYGAATATGHPDNAPVLLRLCGSILDYVGVYVFAGEHSPLREKLQATGSALGEGVSSETAAEIDESVREILSGYSRSVQENQQNAAIEMQQMVGVLGHALTVLSSGSERSVLRLQRIQETLVRTSAIQDISALRASLRDAVQLIGEESSKERQHGAREREGIEAQVVRFRELLAGNPNRRLQGRENAIRALGDCLAEAGTGRRVWALVFVFEQLTAIIQRYGPDVVDELFLHLIQERLQPVAPANSAFRWSASGILGVAMTELDSEAMQAAMANVNRAPLVCRVALGGRTAVLRVGLAHLAVPVSDGQLDHVVEEIDRFTGWAGES